jgi:hypothetical protein
MPVVAVTGARKTGKSTRVRELEAAGPRLYVTLDHLATLGNAQRIRTRSCGERRP